MRLSCLRWAITAAVIVVLGGCLFAVVPTMGQGQSQAYRAPRLARTSRPDLNGIWQALNSANYDIEAHNAQAGPMPRLLGAYSGEPAGLGIVEGGTVPYQPWALAQRRENFKNRLSADPYKREVGDPEAKCFLPGVPRATYMPFPFQIVQSTNAPQIAISYEYASAVRIINMGKPEEAPVDSWMGWSNGSWDGDTLVADVKGFNGLAWFDRAGNFSSETLHVVERYTPTSPDHLMYEATIEDPKVFTRPWKISMPLYRRKDANMQLLEFKCVEFTEDMLLGPARGR